MYDIYITVRYMISYTPTLSLMVMCTASWALPLMRESCYILITDQSLTPPL